MSTPYGSKVSHFVSRRRFEIVSSAAASADRADYQLVACADHGSAILFLRSEIPYDLLLIDFEWRGKEGLELAQLARSLTSRKRMPIILLAATELSSRLKTTAREAGVSKCVTKTPDVIEVSEAIRQ